MLEVSVLRVENRHDFAKCNLIHFLQFFVHFRVFFTHYLAGLQQITHFSFLLKTNDVRNDGGRPMEKRGNGEKNIKDVWGDNRSR